MRILLVAGRHGPRIRGGTVAIHGLALALRDRGQDVTLLHAARPEDHVRLPGIRTEYVNVTDRTFYPLLFATRQLSGYDVIHAWNESGAALAPLARIRRLPFVAEFQPPYVRTEPFWKANWRWRYIEISARSARVIVTATRWLAEGLSARFGLPISRFRIVPHGIGDHWFAQRPPTPGDGTSRVVLVNMKGVDTALRAFAEATTAAETLEVFGDDGQIPGYEKLAGELGVASRVRFHGFVPNRELFDRMGGMSVLLHPSRSGNMDQVLGEAAAMGLPAVTSDVCGNPEVVLDGETGVLCPVDDVGSFARALRTLLGDPDLRRRMGKAARERAQSWRWDRVVEQLEGEVYTRLGGKGSA
jgi:glycosyltransferase involved in cell wall biosynthesis